MGNTMNSIHQPLARVSEAMQDFVRRKDTRLLHVVTTGPLRLAVLEHIAAAEHLGESSSPFFVLEAPCEAEDNGWTARTDELRDDIEALRELLARGEEGIALAPARAASTDTRPKTPFARFGLELRALVERLRAPLEGVVLVLAPLWVRAPKPWIEEVTVLLCQTGLASVRWVIVELEDAVCAPLARALGQRARQVDARVDAAATRAETDEMLAAIGASPSGATGARLCGAAGPPELPPLRKNKTAAVTPILPGEAGLPAAFSGATFTHRLRASTLGAARSMRDGDTPQATRQQREALELCNNAGLVRESVVMELVLGGYALQGGAHALALDGFRRARQRAETAGFAELAVQAQLAVAGSLLAQRRTAEATAAYVEAGQLGAALRSPVLAIEGYRMAGQLLAASGMVDFAGAAWRKALELANSATALDRKASSAADVARALAALCRTHRLPEQAAALEAQAAAMEAPLLTEPVASWSDTTALRDVHDLGVSA
jgi:tetratricopeptide (TPR) repeat protein